MKNSLCIRDLAITAAFLSGITIAGCTARQQSRIIKPTRTAQNTPSVPARIQISDVTAQAGIQFKHNSGAFGLKLMPETMGSGVAVLDFDNDGYQDLFFVNSRYWTREEVEAYRRGEWSQDEKTVFKRHHPPGTKLQRFVPSQIPTARTTGELYRNNGDGTFRNVTKGSGLDVEMFGMGAAVGDYDNDGLNDLYVTGLGRNYLFHNLGQGHFREVASSAGVRDQGWSTSAAWLDYDKDGQLDLFVCHYVQWTPSNDRYGTMNGRDKSYTAPFFYKGEVNRLFHNEGRGRFRDVSRPSGVQTEPAPLKSKNRKSSGKLLPGNALGVAMCDYDNDGWPDLLVSNDGQPNALFRNNHNGTFTDVAQETNIALDASGNTRAGMGVDTADIDHSNRDSAVIGNFDDEMIGLFWNQKSLFRDIAPAGEVGTVSKTYSIFGCLFADVDNDGWADIFTASGHIDEQITGIRGTAYALRPLLFHNQGRALYREIGLQAGAALQEPLVGRGLAACDFDLDGDLDFIMTTNNGPARLLRNDTDNSNYSIRLSLRGQESNRSGIGTLIKAKIGSNVLRMFVRSGSSYLSQSELPVTLGLGNAKQADGIALRWPSGKTTILNNIAANQILTVDEKRGIVHSQPLPRQ